MEIMNILVLLLVSSITQAMKLSSGPAIPNRLSFNYKVDLLKHPEALPGRAKNLQNIITGVYKDMEIEFLDDEGCAKIIEQAHSASLANFFRREQFGPYKSDTCRLAQLFDKGGYYMDNDLEVISDFRKLVPESASFVSVAHPHKDIFQALLGVAPKHPIVKHVLDVMHAAYETSPVQAVGLSAVNSTAKSNNSLKLNSTLSWFGPEKLAQAYSWWTGTAVMDGLHRAEGRESFQFSYMFLEDSNPEQYGLSKRYGQGCCCNYLVGDRSSKKAVFYSRFVGASSFCQ